MILRDYAITTQFEIFDTFTLWVTNIRSHMPLTQKNTMILRDYAITTQFPLIHQKQRPARCVPTTNQNYLHGGLQTL